jgi:hypothetical protein
MPPPSISLIPPEQSPPRPYPFSPPLPNFIAFLIWMERVAYEPGLGFILRLPPVKVTLTKRRV